MSEEDKEFLEKVMKEGIIDENERMKQILKRVAEGLEEIRSNTTSLPAVAEEEEEQQPIATIAATTTANTEELQDEIEGLLQELRDIVEQIDYARAFAAMKGLAFLIGAVTQKEVPTAIKASCLGVLATMAQNNPPIQ
jgi:hsp70-interacting protein